MCHFGTKTTHLPRKIISEKPLLKFSYTSWLHLLLKIKKILRVNPEFWNQNGSLAQTGLKKKKTNKIFLIYFIALLQCVKYEENPSSSYQEISPSQFQAAHAALSRPNSYLCKS